MRQNDLFDRTMMFSIRVMNMVEELPDTKPNRIISDQILRSSSSVGANYRAAQRSKSLKDFINKLRIVEEEADETLYWLQLLEKRKTGPEELLLELAREANELVSIFVVSINTARKSLSDKSS